VFVPSPENRELMAALVPCVNVTAPMTAATPTMTPSAVSSDRNRLAESASSALPTFAPRLPRRRTGCTDRGGPARIGARAGVAPRASAGRC
jgi:hypothetical protein